MSHDKLQEILAEHVRWLRRQGGTRANLRGANLRGADLTGADLTDVDLRGANLRDANLRDADLTDADLACADLECADLTDANLRGGEYLARAGVHFSGHGERGRELLAIRTDAESDPVTLWCGCFVGTPEELAKYISESDERHRKSRTLAANIVLMLLNYADGGGA